MKYFCGFFPNSSTAAFANLPLSSIKSRCVSNDTGDVSTGDTDYNGTILFHVTGDGTITIDGVDYDN